MLLSFSLNKEAVVKSILFGFMASMSLLVLYFFIMILAQNSLSFALEQLNSLKRWVIPLVSTFGLQVGLFVYAKDCRQQVSGKSTTMSAATSGTAMLACCAHHLTDILPIIGLSVLATFLGKYQVWFFALGLLSNVIGISVILVNMKRRQV